MTCSPHVILHGKCGGCGRTPQEIVDELERSVARTIIDLDYDDPIIRDDDRQTSSR